MFRKILKLAPLGAATLFAGAAATAEAAQTRSSAALPAQKPSTTAPQGPKQGFPDNRGLERARQVANANARFLRPDSEG